MTLEDSKNSEEFGCELHQKDFNFDIQKITIKMTVERYILRVNRVLSGKVTTATDDPLQKKALEFRIKKQHIGKFVAPVHLNAG